MPQMPCEATCETMTRGAGQIFPAHHGKAPTEGTGILLSKTFQKFSPRIRMEKTNEEILRHMRRHYRKLQENGASDENLKKAKHKILVLKRLIREEEEKRRSKK